MMIHIYQLNTDGAASEEIDEEEDISAANHWILPSSKIVFLFNFLLLKFIYFYSSCCTKHLFNAESFLYSTFLLDYD